MRTFLEARHMPAVLVLEGEPGIGKTELWRAAIVEASARGFRVLVARGAESETTLSYAGLSDLLSAAVDEVIDGLPAPQRRAIEAALLRDELSGAAPDRRAVSTATLSILRALTEQRPLAIAIDDLHWFDEASTRVLDFALRRLTAEPAVVLATLRPTDDRPALEIERSLSSGVTTRLVIGPLGTDDLARVVGRKHASLSRTMVRRLAEAAAGNPFLALELERAVIRRERDLAPGEPLPVPADLGSLLQARLANLPDDAIEVVLLVAAAGGVDRETLLAAGGERAETGLTLAIDAGVLDSDGGRIRPAHPLLAEAAYARATSSARRSAHERLAETVHDVEERARHLALTTSATDEQIAAELDGAATRACSRGASGAAADLAELALLRTPSDRPEARSSRAMRAADLRFFSGDIARSRELARTALDAATSGHHRAQMLLRWADMEWMDVRRCRALIDEALSHTNAAPSLLLAWAGDQLTWAKLLGGEIASADDDIDGVVEMAERFGDEAAICLARTTRAWVRALRGQGSHELWRSASEAEDVLEGMAYAAPPTLFLGQYLQWAEDLHGARQALERHDRRLVEHGQESLRWDGLQSLAYLECAAGNLEAAARFADDAHEIVLDEKHEQVVHVTLAAKAFVEALRGDVAAARAHASEGVALAEDRGDAFWAMRNRGALGLAELSGGEPKATVSALEPVADFLATGELGEPATFPYLADFAQAAIELGDLDRAEEVVDLLDRLGRPLDRALGLSTAERCRGVLASARGDEVETFAAFDRALEYHDRLGQPFELGRTLLALGECQRRAKRRGAARSTLRSAVEIFTSIGASLWAHRANEEMGRIGGRAAQPDALTETERRVAELAASGSTNREIADRLFISVKTVEANLSRSYQKLAIASRRELRSALGTPESTAEQT